MSHQESNIKNILLRAEVLGKTNWLHAIHILEKASDDYPRERSIYLTLGDVYMRQHKYEQAIGAYQKALTLDAKDEHLMFIIGNCYLSLSDYKMALYYYDQVSAETPELYYNKALAFAYNGQHELSIDNLKILLQRIKDNHNIYYFLVEEFLRLHRYDEALIQLEEIEKRFGKQRYQQILEGFVWNFRKVWIKSYMAFKNADEISPIVNPDHLHTFAQACWQIGLLDKGAELLNKAIDANPYISAIHEDLVRLYLQQKNIQAAETALNRALKILDSANPILLALKGKLKNLVSEAETQVTLNEPHET